MRNYIGICMYTEVERGRGRKGNILREGVDYFALHFAVPLLSLKMNFRIGRVCELPSV